MNSLLVVGSEISVGVADNGNAWTLDGGKVDAPYRANSSKALWQDTEVQFINLLHLEEEMIALNQKLSTYDNRGAVANFEDQNNQWIQVDRDQAVTVYNLDPDKLQMNSYVLVKGMDKTKISTLVVNVDLKGKQTFTIPGTMIQYTDDSFAPTDEVTEWQNGNVIWNIYDSTSDNLQYDGSINNNRVTTAHIVAPRATVDLQQTFNGTVIARDIIVTAESHRTDFTGNTLDLEEKQTLNIPVKKVWVGGEEEQVEIHLYADDVIVDTVTITAKQNWEHVFENLPLERDGKSIVYRVDEVPIEGYETRIEVSDNEFIIINKKIEISQKDITVRKVWNGQSETSVEVTLYADELPVDTITITADQNWEYTFENLPSTREDGSEIIYQVDEKEIDNYESNIIYAQDEIVIVNTYHGDDREGFSIDIPVQKVWIGGEEEQIEIHLYADSVLIDTVIVSEATEWQHVFENLPIEKDGVDIKYTVSETPIDGYEVDVQASDNSIIIVNEAVVQTKVDIPVQKVWIGGEEEQIEIHLYADDILVDTAIMSKATGWQHVFENLQSQENGVDIEYTVSEIPIAGYESVIEIFHDEIVIINKAIEKETIDIPVQKVWIGGEEEQIEIHLYADDILIDTVIMSKATGWQHVFENLPIEKNGVDIKYTLTETPVSGYKTSVTELSDGFVVVNTKQRGTFIDIPIEKVWIGQELSEIEVTLYANGKAVNTVVITSDMGWKHTFKQLPTSNDEGSIIYTISEKYCLGYETEIIKNNQGFRIINTKKTIVTTGNPIGGLNEVDKKTIITTGNPSILVKTGNNSNELFIMGLLCIVVSFTIKRRK